MRTVLTRLQRTVPDVRRQRMKTDSGYVRLKGDLNAYRIEFECLADAVAEAQGMSETDFYWTSRSRELFDKAEEALERGEVEEGWRYFHAIKRVEVDGLKALSNSSLRTRARAILEEATGSLGPWRREAIQRLLCDANGELKDRFSGDEIREASRIMDEQYESIHLKRRYLQSQFNQLLWLGVLTTVAFIGLALLAEFVPTIPVAALLRSPFTTTDAGMASAGFGIFVLLSGMLGASLFGMRSLRRQSLSTKSPQHTTGLRVTTARAVIGAISALVAFFLLQTGILNLGEPTVALVIAISFAAGYSERLVPQAIETVASVKKSTMYDAVTTNDDAPHTGR